MVSIAPARWTIPILFLSLVLAPSAGAQEPEDVPRTVGLDAPDDVTAIEAYRLPDWHYSTLTFDGQAYVNGGGRTQEWADSTFTDRRTEANLQLTAPYRAFWEGESRVARLDVRPMIAAIRQGIEAQRIRGPDSSRTRKSRSTQFRGGLQVGGFWDQYVRRALFFRVEGRGMVGGERRSFFQEERVNGSIDDQSEETTYSGRHSVRTRVGLGIGRVRDVTPVIRALRVRERLEAIGGGGSLPAAEVQRAARQFARRPGYEAVYDRPDKAFWRDFFRRATGLGDDLSPFEAFYVADVLQERFGRRQDGARLVVGPQLAHESEERVRVGGFLRGLWSETLSLRHQLQAEVEGVYNAVGIRRSVRGGGRIHHRRSGLEIVRGDDESQWRGMGRVSWRWSVVDRIQLDSGVHVQFWQPEFTDATETRARLFSSLRIFAEDRFFVEGRGNVGYRSRTNVSGQRAERRRWYWNLGFSVNYILSRSLR